MKPPPVPIPRTGGGEITKIAASLMAAMRCRASPKTVSATIPFASRSAKGVVVKKLLILLRNEAARHFRKLVVGQQKQAAK